MSNCEILPDEVVCQLHTTSARPRTDGDEAFRIPWELRSFALGVAFHEADGFPWGEFQSELVAAIAAAEDADRPEHYYARWIEALESLLTARTALDVSELDRRTTEILETPRDDTHQHAHDAPASVAHGHDHSHDHSHTH